MGDFGAVQPGRPEYRVGELRPYGASVERGDGRVRADIGGAQRCGEFCAVQPGRPEYRVGEPRRDGASVERGDGRVRADIGGAQR